VGSAQTVSDGLADLLEQTEAQELMLAGQIFDHDARLRSFEIAALAMKSLGQLALV
jgi:alkanesulfonate monooxygenase SsuD/methylene tetrahydromethanopterin reductase-like flavin-dependent oxidoreductase (luciferase family)